MYSKSSKGKKIKSFDPSKIYQNKHNLKLPSISNLSIHSNSTNPSLNNQSVNRSNNVDFMLNTI